MGFLLTLAPLCCLTSSVVKCGGDFRIFVWFILWIDILSISCEIGLGWVAQNLIGYKSTLVLVMAWCWQAKSHHLSHCWLSSVSLYGITKPQWVKCGCDFQDFCGRSVSYDGVTVKTLECHGVSNHKQLNCIFNRLFRITSKKISKLSHIDPLWGETISDWWIPFTKVQ